MNFFLHELDKVPLTKNVLGKTNPISRFEGKRGLAVGPEIFV